MTNCTCGERVHAAARRRGAWRREDARGRRSRSPAARRTRFILVARSSTKRGAVLVDDGREVDRAGRERRHVGPQIERAAALRRVASTTAGRELHDHVGTVFTDARLNGGKPFPIKAGLFIIITHVDVHERGSRLERLVRRIDLLRGRDRHRRVVLLRGTEPVMATAMTTGFMARSLQDIGRRRTGRGSGRSIMTALTPAASPGWREPSLGRQTDRGIRPRRSRHSSAARRSRRRSRSRRSEYRSGRIRRTVAIVENLVLAQPLDVFGARSVRASRSS